jgi:hypothetical protein
MNRHQQLSTLYDTYCLMLSGYDPDAPYPRASGLLPRNSRKFLNLTRLLFDSIGFGINSSDHGGWCQKCSTAVRVRPAPAEWYPNATALDG